jgi:ABC-type branched-subunit amino acid transport system ATPase component
MDILALKEISGGYQEGVDILQSVSLTVEKRSLTVLIGPNGAGKSTMLKTIFGFLKPREGGILFDKHEIHPLLPYQIKRLGVSYVPQGINLFPQLTVEENLKLGGWILRKDKARLDEQLDKIYGIFPVLKELRSTKATKLSGGQSKMLSIAKEVITEPSLMLVDEPAAGLAPQIAAQAYDFLLNTKEALGASILLVDHNMEKAVEISDYVYVLNLGQIKCEGPKREFEGGRIKDVIRECLLVD